MEGPSRNRPACSLFPLLDEQANVSERVLPLCFGQLSLPRVHRAEDNAVLDRPEEFFV